MTTAAMSFPPQELAGVLVASANTAVRRHVVEELKARQWPVEEACGGADALEKLESTECDLLLLDRHLPDLNAEELELLIHAQYPGVDVLLLDTGTRRMSATKEIRRATAARLLQELVSGQTAAEVPTQTENVPVSVALPVGAAAQLPGMIGSSLCMNRVYRMVRIVAPHNTSVLITGDSGTGKELVAEALHKLSDRATKPFVVVNCAAIPEALLESELFGYVRGAFTGAVQARIGRIHSAQGGTLFLDEIGELPLGLQAKLLRFLESGEIQRLGSSDVFRVDVRVIAATNAELEQKVARGEFRKDLYYRLTVFPISLPQLQKRKSDILPLAEHFLRKLGHPEMKLSGAAADLLQKYDWPGNVRELRNVMERASILAGRESVISSEHIILSPIQLLSAEQ